MRSLPVSLLRVTATALIYPALPPTPSPTARRCLMRPSASTPLQGPDPSTTRLLPTQSMLVNSVPQLQEGTCESEFVDASITAQRRSTQFAVVSPSCHGHGPHLPRTPSHSIPYRTTRPNTPVGQPPPSPGPNPIHRTSSLNPIHVGKHCASPTRGRVRVRACGCKYYGPPPKCAVCRCLSFVSRTRPSFTPHSLPLHPLPHDAA